MVVDDFPLTVLLLKHVGRHHPASTLSSVRQNLQNGASRHVSNHNKMCLTECMFQLTCHVCRQHQ